MYFILAILLIFPFAAMGQIDDVKTLSWQEVLELARKHNPELRAQYAALRASRADYDGSRSGFYPQLVAGFDVTKSHRSSQIDQADASERYDLSLSLRQNIFDGFADSQKVKKAKTAVNASKLEVLTTKLRLGFDLVSSFSSLSFAQASELLQEKIIGRRQENLNIVTLRFENGRENKGSVLQSEAYLAAARFELDKARQDQLVFKRELYSLIGLDKAEKEDKSWRQLTLNGVVPTEKPLADESLDLKALALLHPDVKLARARAAMAMADVGLSRARFYPSLETRAQYGLGDDSFFPNQSAWSISLGVSYPLYSGGADSAALRKAKQSYLEAKLSVRASVNRQLDSLEKSLLSYRQAYAQLDVEKAFEKAAIVRAEIARSKYNNGLMSFEEWDRLESELMSRQKSVLRLERDLVQSYAAWLKAQGKGVL
jgi:outer membrane protein TolC